MLKKKREGILMAAKKVGDLIKEARTNAGLTQEKLARKVKGVSASDISKAERGEMELTQAVLKEIAKITGVTQKSLLEAPKGASSSSKKTSSSSSKSTKKTTEKIELTAAEKTLVKLYRAADSDTKKAAVSLLKGETTTTSSLLDSLLGGTLDALSNLGKK